MLDKLNPCAIRHLVRTARLALREWGAKRQAVKCMEECGELTQALAKWHDKPTLENKERVQEELADVLMMVTQMSMVVFREPLDFEHQLGVKLEKLEGKLSGKARQAQRQG